MERWRGGDNDLAGYHVPAEVQTRAAILVLHAFAEHAGRHERAMRRFAARGIASYAYDHRGHGRSPGRRALVRQFDELADDALMMFDAMAQRESAHPHFLLGAGMGGVLAAHLALRRPDDFAGVILVGPTFSGGTSTSGVVRRVLPLVANFVPTISAETHDIRGLSRNPVIVKEFREDPLTHRGGVPAQTGQELQRAAAEAIAYALDLTVPLLVIHGANDSIASIKGSRRFVEGAGSDDKRLYEIPAGHHEPFNDPGGDTLIDEVGIWIRERSRR
jgi:alpha-beta hydrolase superfamily lysophospholipase